MRAHRIEQRLDCLEERYRDRLRPPARVFQCIVRKGREDGDREAAFSALGMWPTADDLIVCMVAVNANPTHQMDHVRPVAALVSG